MSDGDPTLAVVCGLPGVGKTTVSGAIADRIDGRLLRTDVVRKEIIDDPEYDDEEERLVYGAVFDRAESALQAGENAVLDGTFRRPRQRDRARSIADDTGARLRLVRVTCDDEVVRERIRKRTDDESDADYETYALYRDLFEPLERDHDVVDNSGAVERTRRHVADLF